MTADLWLVAAIALPAVASLGLVTGIAWGPWSHLRRRRKEDVEGGGRVVGRTP